jgi:2-dehydropantoate 2-reductase
VIDASVLVIGGGAIGGVTAGLMTGQVRRVAVLDANGEHVSLLRDPGLRLDVLGTERIVPLEGYRSVAELDGRFDFGLVTLKAQNLEAALPGIVERDLVEDFVGLGNGLVQDRVAALVGRDRLIAGIVEWGATNLGPGHLSQTTRNVFVVGELDGPVRARTERLARVLGTVAEVRVSTNIRGQIWSKLLVNSAFSGLGVVGGVLYRDIAADAAGRRALCAVWTEGHRVGLAQGLELEPVLGIAADELVVAGDGPAGAPDSARIERALETALALAGATKASMLQDVERGALTEVDVINGAVVERAAAHGLAAPLNTRVVELVHQFERGERAPSPDLFEELAALAGA